MDDVGWGRVAEDVPAGAPITGAKGDDGPPFDEADVAGVDSIVASDEWSDELDVVEAINGRLVDAGGGDMSLGVATVTAAGGEGGAGLAMASLWVLCASYQLRRGVHEAVGEAGGVGMKGRPPTRRCPAVRGPGAFFVSSRTERATVQTGNCCINTTPNPGQNCSTNDDERP